MGVSSADDAILLRSYALEGDARAFAELVQRYAGLVYATARRITGSADAAEDVAQDCFLRLAQRSAAISGSVAAWLHRTSVNRSLEIIRSERARKQREANASPRDPADTDDSTELIARVDQALAALPDDLRTVVTEHFLCGKTQVELAAAMGVNQSTVSRRIDHGIERLRQRLHDDGCVALPLALPLLLHNSFAAAVAPASVCSALTKIGLSGVGRAAGAKAGTSVALRIAVGLFASATVTAAALAIHSYMAPSPARQPAAAAASGDGEVDVKFAQVPAPAQRTLLAVSGRAKIDTVDKETRQGKVVYSIDTTINGKTWEIRVAEDGTLVSKQPGTE